MYGYLEFIDRQIKIPWHFLRLFSNWMFVLGPRICRIRISNRISEMVRVRECRNSPAANNDNNMLIAITTRRQSKVETQRECTVWGRWRYYPSYEKLDKTEPPTCVCVCLKPPADRHQGLFSERGRVPALYTLHAGYIPRI